MQTVFHTQKLRTGEVWVRQHGFLRRPGPWSPRTSYGMNAVPGIQRQRKRSKHFPAQGGVTSELPGFDFVPKWEEPPGDSAKQKTPDKRKLSKVLGSRRVRQKQEALPRERRGSLQSPRTGQLIASRRGTEQGRSLSPPPPGVLFQPPPQPTKREKERRERKSKPEGRKKPKGADRARWC